MDTSALSSQRCSCTWATLRAQVDWSELFPGEGGKPAAPKPRVVQPPAARPLPRVQEPAPYKVARPKAAQVKTRQHANAKPSRRIARSSPIVQSRPEEEPEFPAAAEVAAPQFDRQSKQRQVQQAVAPRPEPEAAALRGCRPGRGESGCRHGAEPPLAAGRCCCRAGRAAKGRAAKGRAPTDCCRSG